MKHPLLVTGVVVGAVGVAAYVYAAVRYKKVPDLAEAVHIFGGVVGAVGSLRLFELALQGEFTDGPSPLDLSVEDSVAICFGGLALVWTSCQLVLRAFRELRGP